MTIALIGSEDNPMTVPIYHRWASSALTDRLCQPKNAAEPHEKQRANESALKMPADRRDNRTDFPMKLGEWAFSMERLTDSFRLHNQKPFPKRIPKVSFGESLLTFAS